MNDNRLRQTSVTLANSKLYHINTTILASFEVIQTTTVLSAAINCCFGLEGRDLLFYEVL